MKMKLFILTLLCMGAVQLGCGADTDGPIVELASGKVRGLVQEVNGQKIHFFQGIRYGQAKRFEKPTEAPSWTGIYDATKWRDACPQPGIVKPPPGVPAVQTSKMSEDCLMLNVWAPTTGTTNKTVIAFIHGGGFIVGTIFNNLMDGKYLASHDVVVVMMNYRLGAFGFLYGGTQNTPGNLGFHDVILALKWIKQNIAQFGGDPSKITIAGESAGSFVTGSMIVATPLTKGLFHRAIMQSGSPTSLTGGIPLNRSLANTKKLAEHLNCPVNSNQAAVDCLQKKPLMAIVNYTVMDFQRTDQFFTPVYGDQVAPISPIQAVKLGMFNKGIDLMYGVTRDEGTMFALNMFPSYASNASNLTIESVKKDIIHMFELYWQPFGKEVAEYYTKGMKNPSQDELKQATSRAYGDYHILCPTILFGEQTAQANTRTWAYRLDQHAGIPALQYFPWMGVQHTDDLMYLFGVPLLHKAEDKQLSSIMLSAWTSYAKFGSPSIANWTEALSKSVTAPKTRFYSLSTASPKMVNGFYTALCDGFWKPRISQL